MISEASAASPQREEIAASSIPKIVSSLSPEQLSIIHQEDDKVDSIVVAGPGTGKTYCLAARVVYLIVVKKVPASQILVLSDNADFLSALIDFNSPISSGAAVVKTFTNMARSLLKDFYGPDSPAETPQLVSRAEEVALFDNLKKQKKISIPEEILYRFTSDQLVRYFDMLATAAISPEVYMTCNRNVFEVDLSNSLEDLKSQRMSERQIKLVTSGRVESVNTHVKLAELYSVFKKEMMVLKQAGACGVRISVLLRCLPLWQTRRACCRS